MSPFPIGTRRRRTRRLLAHAAIAAALVVLAAGRFLYEVAELRALHRSGPSWSFPSRVYSDGVPFVPGMTLPRERLARELAARGYRPARGEAAEPGTWSAEPRAISIVTRGFLEARDPAGFGGPERVRLAIANGRLVSVRRLGGLAGHPPPDTLNPPRLEPVLVARLEDDDRVRRTWVPIERVPEVVREAIVASEDRRFYTHVGLDPRGNLRAALANLRARGVREGASTITQQLARGLWFGTERTVTRKLLETAAAVGLELTLTKREILEMYLNSVFWGRGHGGSIGGIAEAARFYCDAPVESLDVADAALLAGLIPAPNAASPFRNPRLARARRDMALRDMLAAGVIDAAAAERVRATPLPRRPGRREPDRFPSYVDVVREALGELPAGRLDRGGLAVFTRMDLAWQEVAERELAAGLARHDAGGRRAPRLEGAFVAIEPASGAIRALAGGRANRSGDFNRATRARRQCGSAIKPIVYAAALDPARRGPRFSPASTVPDLRRTFGHGEHAWTPQNSKGEYHESVTLARALALSLNVATATLVDSIGAGEVAREAERFGLRGLRPVPSIGLGSGEVTLLDLAGAYAVFPAGGVRHEPTPIRAVVDAPGREIARRDTPPRRVIPPLTAALLCSMLENVVEYGIASPLRRAHGVWTTVGGKTGTTNEARDAWFMGVTPELAAGVWVGYDRPRPLGRDAAAIALPVWAGIARPMLEGVPARPFAGVEALEEAWLDGWTGLRAGAQCPNVMRLRLAPGTVPSARCDRDHAADWQRLLARRFADSLAVWISDSTVAADSAGRSIVAPR